MANRDHDYDDHVRALHLRTLEANLKEAELRAEKAHVELETAQIVHRYAVRCHEGVVRPGGP